MAKTYDLDFNGYWQDKNKSGLPHVPGIYCVYKGTLQPGDTVLLDKIVYIGEAEDINSRHNDSQHEHYNDFVKVCGGVDHIWYSYAKVLGGETERKHVENALIYELQPKINNKGKQSFDYKKTTINSSGAKIGVPNTFTIEDGGWELDV